MADLVLGVLDVAYSDPDTKLSKDTEQALKKLGIHAPEATLTTTGEVATKLEKRYGVMEVFLELYKDKIENLLAEAYAKRLDDIFNGRRVSKEIFHDAMRQIEDLFRGYLDKDEWQHHTGGIIRAARAGVSFRHGRMKLTKAEIAKGISLLEADLAAIFNLSGKRGPRPAFISTGLYQESMKAWFQTDPDEKAGA